jgi:hypothetical protein
MLMLEAVTPFEMSKHTSTTWDIIPQDLLTSSYEPSCVASHFGRSSLQSLLYEP